MGVGRVEKVADWLGYLFWFHAAVWSDIHLRGRYLKNARESLKLPGVASFSRICFLKIPLARLCLLLHGPIPPPRIPPTDISPPFGRITHNFPSKYAYPHQRKKKTLTFLQSSDYKKKQDTSNKLRLVVFDSVSVISLGFVLQINTYSGLLRNLFQSASICVSNSSTDCIC